MKNFFIYPQFIKYRRTLFFSFSLSPFTYTIEEISNWFINNSEYLLFVFGAITIDHILGSIVHLYIKKDFTFKDNLWGLLIKIGLVITIGFLYEGIDRIIEEESFFKGYLKIVLHLSLFLYPAGSALSNSAIITKGKFPPIGLMKWIHQFNKQLNIKDFETNENITKRN